MICKICNKELKSLKGLCCHISQKHKQITFQQYYELFLWDKTECKICKQKPKFINFVRGFSEYCGECLIKMYSSSFRIQNGITSEAESQKHFEKISKHHLEMYDFKRKNGVKILTPTTLEYWLNRGYSQEESENIRREFLQKTWKANKNYRENEPERYEGKQTTQLEYWINKGLSEPEAKKKLKERQSTFTLEKCIEKYGEEEGSRIYKERQIKWGEKIKLNPNYEEIKVKRLCKNKVSKSSQKFFNCLYQKLDMGRNIFFHNINEEYTFVSKSGEIYKLDFYDADKKICIEYNGDYWHNNPFRIEWDKKEQKP